MYEHTHTDLLVGGVREFRFQLFTRLQVFWACGCVWKTLK